MKDIQKELDGRLNSGVPTKHFHNMSTLQWQYSKEMAELAGIETTMPVIEKLFTAVREARNKTLMTYKTNSYIVTGPETYECVC